MRDKSYQKVGLLGLVLTLIATVIIVVSPPPSQQPGAHSSQIVTFEFVDTPEELRLFHSQLCESEEVSCATRKQQIDLVNYIDFGMMIVYGLFLFFFTKRLSEQTADPLLANAKFLAPLVVIFDALENVQMLLMNKASFDGAEHIFLCLSLFTRLKWGLLAALIALIGYGMRHLPRARWLGYVLILPAIIGLYALITESYLAIEIWTVLIFLSMLLLVIFCFIYKSGKLLLPESNMRQD